MTNTWRLAQPNFSEEFHSVMSVQQPIFDTSVNLPLKSLGQLNNVFSS